MSDQIKTQYIELDEDNRFNYYIPHKRDPLASSNNAIMVKFDRDADGGVFAIARRTGGFSYPHASVAMDRHGIYLDEHPHMFEGDSDYNRAQARQMVEVLREMIAQWDACYGGQD